MHSLKNPLEHAMEIPPPQRRGEMGKQKAICLILLQMSGSNPG